MALIFVEGYEDITMQPYYSESTMALFEILN